MLSGNEKSKTASWLVIDVARPTLWNMSMPTHNPAPIVQVDIISDIMCPWCIVGFKQLELALWHTGLGARIRWHPFELNPDMPPSGERLDEHLQRKYGLAAQDRAKARADLQDIGAALGFSFNHSAGSRIVNSFEAHCLLDYAATQGLQHPLKLALFAAHFTERRDVSDRDTLVRIAQRVGLDPDACRSALEEDRHKQAVRAQQKVWGDVGVQSVPTMIFAEQFIVTGAQGPDAYARLLQKLRADLA